MNEAHEQELAPSGAGNSSTLPHETTMRLIAASQCGDESALESLILHNSALVKSIVKRYINRGTEYDDLYQIGCMGLVKAIRNFNTDYNVRFSTYAVPMIAGEIKRYLRDDGMIKVSRSLKEIASRAAAAQEALIKREMKEPGIAEIASYINESPEDVALALEASRPHVSIYEPAYGDDSDALVVDKVVGGIDETNSTINRILLKELLFTLDARERQIIMLRFFQDKTQNQIAQILGISQVQVSRLETKILSKMREKAR